MNKSQKVCIGVLALSMSVLVSACGAGEGSDPSGAGSQSRGIVGTKDRPMSWDASIAEGFHELKAAKRAAHLIVRGVAGDSTVETVSGVPFTITEFASDKAIKGANPDAPISIRQFGDAYNTDDAFAPLLEKGKSYLLLLEPFEFEPGVPTGQWVIVGGVAAWSEGSNGELRRMAKESDLPVTLSTAQVEGLS